MNKYVKIFLFFLATIVVLWVVGRITNTFQYYNAPSSSNEPGIKKGERFFASNLVKPKRMDFICFNTETPEFGKAVWVFRVCGLSGDVVEIKRGDLFVNNEPVDKKIDPMHLYYVPVEEYERIKDSIRIDEDFPPDLLQGSVMLFLEDSYVSKSNINARRFITEAKLENVEIEDKFRKPWNVDNFGPIKVPADKYFVLGDNRHNAQDSRYIGFIDKEDFVATVLWK